MKFVETDPREFEFIRDFPFDASYVQVDPAGLVMAYIDEGPRDAPTVLLLHGEPSWSYLYRKMIPPLLDRGYRVVAPDLIGFGRSSKPTRRSDYSYASHTRWLLSFIELVDLHDITLFAQDWGSLLGLRLVGEREHLFAGVVIGNGFLPDGSLFTGGKIPWKSAAAFLTWRTFSQLSPILPIGKVLNVGSQGKLTAEEIRAYEAPFPGRKYTAGAREFPALVPMRPSDPEARRNAKAWKTLERWNKPFVTAFSHGDPIMRGLDEVLQRRIPGASGQRHIRVKGGHFLQERSPLELTEAISDVVEQIRN